MKLFWPDTRNKSPEHQRIYALFEVWYTTVDFAAAFLFVAGSILFFWKDTQTLATWLFVVGSVCFALKPTIRMLREVKYLSMGDIRTLADRDKSA